MTTATIRTYSELRRLTTLEDRFEYLAVRAAVGAETFGSERYLNQVFYRSAEWRNLRHHVIYRDDGCELGVAGFDVFDRAHIHHMNPITVQQIRDRDPEILDPEFLITCSLNVHNAIHFGDARLLPRGPTERKPGDTKLWGR